MTTKSLLVTVFSLRFPANRRYGPPSHRDDCAWITAHPEEIHLIVQPPRQTCYDSDCC